MSATAHAPLVRAGPGVSAWTACPGATARSCCGSSRATSLSTDRVSAPSRPELSRFVLLVRDAMGFHAMSYPMRCPRY